MHLLFANSLGFLHTVGLLVVVCIDFVPVCYSMTSVYRNNYMTAGFTDYWTNTHASVVCQELGLSPYGRFASSSVH